MKRWAGLLALFLLAAISAVVIAPRFAPSELERRHATIRVGMTASEVVKIMDARVEPLTFLGASNLGSGFTWSYLPPRRFLARDVRLEVDFDTNSRVIRTTVDGEQRQP
jgi:hypothetical protein